MKEDNTNDMIDDNSILCNGKMVSNEADCKNVITSKYNKYQRISLVHNNDMVIGSRIGNDIPYKNLKEIKTMYGLDESIDFSTFCNNLKNMNDINLYSEKYIQQLYFHYIISVGNYYQVHKWIAEYIDKYSIDTLNQFINLPIYLPVTFGKNKIKTSYDLYPIVTCAMWNNNTELIRLLVSFGAVIDISDCYGFYPEEALQYISYLYPLPFMLSTKDYNIDNILYYRIVEEFKEVIKELKCIAGECVSKNWTYPL